MPLSLDQSFVNDFQALAESLDQPELLLAARLIDLAWHRQQAGQDARNRWISLTQRQQEIALLIRAGHTYPQIAQALHLSKNSVHAHVRQIYAKMGVASKKELRAIMIDSDLLDEYMQKFHHLS
jgi:DNA-binding CsgD family transcriptional regulator